MKSKLISHCEHFRVRHIDSTPLDIKPTVRRITTQSVHATTGRIISKCEFRSIDRADEMKPFRLSDFYLNNLLAVGAKLDPVLMHSSPLRQVDDITTQLSSMEPTQKNNNN